MWLNGLELDHLEGLNITMWLKGLDMDQLEGLRKGFEGFDKEGSGTIG